MPRSGRRPGTSDSREKILAAARSHFAKEGYDGATIRGIAATARVDPSLVLHFFGSKEHLFVATMQLPEDPREFVPALMAHGVDGLGERLASFFLETWDAPRGRPFIALLRSVTSSEKAAAMMRQFVAREILSRVAGALDLDRPKLRAALAASHLVGLAFVRYVIKLEPIASADRHDLARTVGPVIQHYFSTAASRPRGSNSRQSSGSTGIGQPGSGRQSSHVSSSGGSRRRKRSSARSPSARS
jgi:AcrR family transcriptional regulator